LAPIVNPVVASSLCNGKVEGLFAEAVIGYCSTEVPNPKSSIGDAEFENCWTRRDGTTWPEKVSRALSLAPEGGIWLNSLSLHHSKELVLKLRSSDSKQFETSSVVQDGVPKELKRASTSV